MRSAASRRSARWRWARRAIAPVDMLVGPGNAFVAEAKRQLFGRVGIDLFAGPDRDAGHRRRDGGRRTLRDRPARPGRARTGHRPAILLTTSEKLARDTMAEIERLLGDPADRRHRRARPGRDYGEVIVARQRRGDGQGRRRHRLRARAGDDRAIPTISSTNMTNYGALFLGPRTNVAYRRQGDRHQSHAADEEGGALHGRAVGRASSSRPAPTSGC